jgi:Ca-activated chloride channel family protein
MRTRIWIAVVAVVLFVPLVTAQVDRGVLSGVVTDASGVAIPGATVTITGPETRTTVTDAKGAYSFRSLRPGEYTVESRLAGFRTSVATVRVLAGRTERLDVTLAVGGLSETVVVTGRAPAVDVQNARQAISGTVSGVAGGRAAPPPAAGPFGGYIRPRAGDAETYAVIEDNRFHRVDGEPLSTFSIDVDTASYANVRRFLGEGRLPPPDAVRIEELVNYFRFDYPEPTGDAPFSITTEIAEAPWNPDHRLVLVGLQGRALADREPSPRNLVFLLDVSGSMASADKLPLVRTAMRMLTDVLTARDRVAIVVYAGASGVVLPSTPGNEKTAIHEAIARLKSGGSTNGGAGIQLAYRIAQEQFIEDGVNRVILATDGDFNVGITDRNALVRLIEQERESGIFLSVLGVGTGNLKDATMEQLADRGNGNYAYLDSLHEARKVLVQQAGSTLETIAKDVKIQVEFNPREVAAYRLIGYENRLLAHEDFNDDRKDAGEIGAGHSVTALYEVVPVGVEAPGVDPLRYQQQAPEPVLTPEAATGELLTVKVRYKAPAGDTSRLLTRRVTSQPAAMTGNLGFASAVAEFGMVLRGSPDRGSADLTAASERGRRFRGADDEGYRTEFVRLAELAASLPGALVGTESRR